MNKDNKPGSAYVAYALVANVGMQLVVSTVIGFGIGYWLDKKLNTRPVFMLIVTVLGIAAGFLNLYRTVKETK